MATMCKEFLEAFMNTDDLMKKYPGIFPADSFYFECGSGWALLIDELCHEMAQHHDFNVKNKPKNKPKIKPVVCVQAKTKFGGLRFYVEGGDDYTHGLIRMAESFSLMICEHCGERCRPGTPATRWNATRCDNHK